MSRFRPSRTGLLVLAAGFLVVGSLVAVRPARAEAPKEEPVALAAALTDLATLEGQLKKRATQNEDLLGSLDAVSKAYHNLQAPEPAADPKVAEADKVKFEADKKDFQKKAESAFLDALVLMRPSKTSEGTNEREDVNIKAAVILGATGSTTASPKIIAEITTKLLKAKHTVGDGVWEATFASLGNLNDPKSLAWMKENFIHTRSSPPAVVSQLKAAQKAMVLFKNPPGILRHGIVEEMVKTYAGTESQASQSKTDPAIQAAKQFWDAIKTDTIKVVQALTKDPVANQDAATADGQALATMKEFQDWFRDHKNPRQAPWVDPKPAPAAPAKDDKAGEAKTGMLSPTK